MQKYLASRICACMSEVNVEGKSESSEKKAVRKKKSKKGKKSEEKENISVEQETKTRNKELEISPTIDDFDDLSNVSVKNLVSHSCDMTFFCIPRSKANILKVGKKNYLT
ncbi:hypothetical protein RUM43_013348 [Polyplax serrata]|uniref:Uncharacterized protein n=1 Tax=Polyplax serrata TaxID=468196 RepID=A0AAN8RY95_POLSC